MALKCGIVGLPNVGKSTLFNAVSGNAVDASNFPFCTIDTNTGVVSVPDERLGILNQLVKPQRVIPTSFEFVDIAGLVKGASRGQGLGNQFLAAIREVDAIVHVVRCFDDVDVVHVEGKIDPIADKEIIDSELQLKDLEVIEKKIATLQRVAKGGDPVIRKKMDIFSQYRDELRKGINARAISTVHLSEEDHAELQLLTYKPVIYVANIKEGSTNTKNDYLTRLEQVAKEEEAEIIPLCAALEAQISELQSEEDKKDFLEEYGLKESGLDKLIRSTYSLLGLITYFTAGEKEVRAWTIQQGYKAPQAAGVIHSDFERGFIKAEVIKLTDYQHYKTESGCRESGKLSIEGKEYVVQDGDIIHFRFNV